MRTGFSDDEKAKNGAYIRKLREEHHISQSELAEKLQVDRAAVCQWENGKTTPKPLRLRQMAELFDTNVDSLLDPPQERPISPLLENLTSALEMFASRTAEITRIQRRKEDTLDLGNSKSNDE